MEKLSVIITAYDRHDLTVVHARECMNSERMPDEVIVVNDGGTPDLEEKLSKLDFKCRFVYARVNEDIPWNYNGACNLGVWLSTGDYLALEDNDNIPTYDFYDKALRHFKVNPEVGRVTSRVRWLVSVEDMLNKPREEWKVEDTIGANQGTAIIKRDIYLQIKGQDERFCGAYGWMYYELKRKLLNRVGTKFSSIGAYYHTQEGQSGLSRSMSTRNASLLKNNTRENVIQAPNGILNFTYTYKILHP